MYTMGCTNSEKDTVIENYIVATGLLVGAVEKYYKGENWSLQGDGYLLMQLRFGNLLDRLFSR